jgi:hypothetical protein
MPMYDDLLAALDRPTVLGSVQRRGTTWRQFFAALRDRLVTAPDDADQIGPRLAAVHRAHFPTMPEHVSQDLALCDMRIALSRDDLGPPPVSVSRARVRTAGRRETRSERRARILGAAAAVVDQARTEAAAARYAEQAAKWYGVGDPKPRVTIK